MAETNYPVGHALAVQHWSKKLAVEALSKTDMLRFMGKGSDSMIQYKEEAKKVGEKITFGLRMQLTGDGIDGDNTLEDNEEALVTYSDSIWLDQLRHAVRSKGAMSEHRVHHSTRDEAKDGLADWWADRIDTSFFNQLGGVSSAATKYSGMQAAVDPIAASDTDHYFFPDSDTSEADVASSGASSIFQLSLIDEFVAKAKTISPLIRPIKIKGGSYFVAFLHPFQVYDLRTNTSTGQWLDILKAAMTGGQVTKNPIFTGALGMYNGVVLHENTRVPLGVGQTQVRRAIFCGAQAGAVAFAKGNGPNKFSWKEKAFDYDNKLGVAAGAIWGAKKCRFNSKDFGTIICPTYTTKS
jgi:N4-gp56 family major capsid protein